MNKKKSIHNCKYEEIINNEKKHNKKKGKVFFVYGEKSIGKSYFVKNNFYSKIRIFNRKIDARKIDIDKLNDELFSPLYKYVKFPINMKFLGAITVFGSSVASLFASFQVGWITWTIFLIPLHLYVFLVCGWIIHRSLVRVIHVEEINRTEDEEKIVPPKIFNIISKIWKNKIFYKKQIIFEISNKDLKEKAAELIHNGIDYIFEINLNGDQNKKKLIIDILENKYHEKCFDKLWNKKIIKNNYIQERQHIKENGLKIPDAEHTVLNILINLLENKRDHINLQKFKQKINYFPFLVKEMNYEDNDGVSLFILCIIFLKDMERFIEKIKKVEKIEYLNKEEGGEYYNNLIYIYNYSINDIKNLDKASQNKIIKNSFFGTEKIYSRYNSKYLKKEEKKEDEKEKYILEKIGNKNTHIEKIFEIIEDRDNYICINKLKQYFNEYFIDKINISTKIDDSKNYKKIITYVEEFSWESGGENIVSINENSDIKKLESLKYIYKNKNKMFVGWLISDFYRNENLFNLIEDPRIKEWVKSFWWLEVSTNVSENQINPYWTDVGFRNWDKEIKNYKPKTIIEFIEEYKDKREFEKFKEIKAYAGGGITNFIGNIKIIKELCETKDIDNVNKFLFSEEKKIILPNEIIQEFKILPHSNANINSELKYYVVIREGEILFNIREIAFKKPSNDYNFEKFRNVFSDVFNLNWFNEKTIVSSELGVKDKDDYFGNPGITIKFNYK